MENLNERDEDEYDGFLDQLGRENESLYQKLSSAIPGREIRFSRRAGEFRGETAFAIILLAMGIPFIAGFLYVLPNLTMSRALAPLIALASVSATLYLVLLGWLLYRRVEAWRLDDLSLLLSTEKGMLFLALIDHRGRTRATSYLDMHDIRRVWMHETRRFRRRWQILLADAALGGASRPLPLPGLGRTIAGYRHVADQTLKFIRVNFPAVRGNGHAA
jgi:hypothetical protein